MGDEGGEGEDTPLPEGVVAAVAAVAEVEVEIEEGGLGRNPSLSRIVAQACRIRSARPAGDISLMPVVGGGGDDEGDGDSGGRCGTRGEEKVEDGVEELWG